MPEKQHQIYKEMQTYQSGREEPLQTGNGPGLEQQVNLGTFTRVRVSLGDHKL